MRTIETVQVNLVDGRISIFDNPQEASWRDDLLTVFSDDNHRYTFPASSVLYTEAWEWESEDDEVPFDLFMGNDDQPFTNAQGAPDEL